MRLIARDLAKTKQEYILLVAVAAVFGGDNFEYAAKKALDEYRELPD